MRPTLGNSPPNPSIIHPIRQTWEILHPLDLLPVKKGAHIEPQIKKSFLLPVSADGTVIQSGLVAIGAWIGWVGVDTHVLVNPQIAKCA